MASYFPRSNGNLGAWLQNYILKLPAIGASCGMSDADIKKQIDLAQQLLDHLNNAAVALANSKKATAAKQSQKESTESSVRKNIANLKSHPNWTDTYSKDLLADGPASVFDAATYKARLIGKVNGGAVQLRINKRGVEAVNIYANRKGDTEFVLLKRVGRSSYTDTRPLEKPGVAEIRQYMAIGVVADEEIGLASDIVTVVFG